MKSEEFSWKTNDGLSIAAVEWRPEGRVKAVVALVHGLGEHHGRYLAKAERFCGADIAVIAFDLPGHGKSGGKRGDASYDQVEEQIDRLLMECCLRHSGLPVFLYGHSLGGAIVLDYILRYSPAIVGAVVTSPGLAPAKPVPAAKMFVARLMAKLAPSFTLANDLDVEGVSRDRAIIDAYKTDPLVHDMISARLGLDLIERGKANIARAAEIKIPLLLLQGTADRLVDSKATESFAAGAGKNITYRRFDGWYHELHNEPGKEEVFSGTIEWMLARLGQGERQARS